MAVILKLFDFENEQNLIVDLRGNEGGAMKNVKELLRYVIDEPVIQAKEGRVVKNKNQEEFSKRTKKHWYPWSGIGKVRPKRKNFKGSLFILVDEGSSSASPAFAQVLRKVKRATIIGNETGVNPIILNGFIMGLKVKISNTKHKIYSGNYSTFIDDIELNNEIGLIPDYILKPGISDLNTPRNNVLQFTFDLIQKQ